MQQLSDARMDNRGGQATCLKHDEANPKLQLHACTSEGADVKNNHRGEAQQRNQSTLSVDHVQFNANYKPSEEEAQGPPPRYRLRGAGLRPRSPK